MLFVAFTDASTATTIESPIWVNVENVKYFKPAIAGQTSSDGTILALGGNDFVTVSESTEEVLALLEVMIDEDAGGPDETARPGMPKEDIDIAKG
jgi:hypothetical protein